MLPEILYSISWFGCSDHHPNPHPFLLPEPSLSISLCSVLLLYKLFFETLASLEFQNLPYLSVALSLYCLCSSGASIHCFLLPFSISSLPDFVTFPPFLWRKASSIYLTISSPPNRPISPGPPKVLPLFHFCICFFSNSLVSICAFNGFDRCKADLRLKITDLKRLSIEWTSSFFVSFNISSLIMASCISS